MATDKALPNEVRKEINIPSIEDIQVDLEKEPVEKGPVEVQQNEDPNQCDHLL